MFLETRRLTLRKFREEDFSDFAAWAVDEEICRMMDRNSDARLAFDWLKNHEERSYVLTSKKNDSVIGNLTVCAVPRELACLEVLTGRQGVSLSFSISRDHRRRGLMYEALAAVIRHLFDEEGMDYIQCGHFPCNTASAALQKKLGFSYLTTLCFQDGDSEIVSIENILWRTD